MQHKQINVEAVTTWTILYKEVKNGNQQHNKPTNIRNDKIFHKGNHIIQLGMNDVPGFLGIKVLCDKIDQNMYDPENNQ